MGEDKEKAERNTAALLVIVGIIIHLADVLLRLNGSSYFSLHIGIAVAYLIYVFLAAAEYPKDKSILIFLGLASYFIPLINTLPGIPEAIRGTIVFLTPILPIYIALSHAGVPVKLATLLYVLFIWIPLLGISLTLPNTELQQKLQIPWAISPGYVIDRTTERISLWWYGLKERIPTSQDIQEGRITHETKEEEKEVPLKEMKYAGVVLPELEIEKKQINEKEMFEVEPRDKLLVESPTPINVYLACYAEDTETKKIIYSTYLSPSKLESIKKAQKDVLCRFGDGLPKGVYDIKMSQNFEYTTIAEIPINVIPENLPEELKKKTKEKIKTELIKPQLGPLNIELTLPPDRIIEIPETTQEMDVVYTKITNAWKGKIKEIKKIQYILPKGMSLADIGGTKTKQEKCSDIKQTEIRNICVTEENEVYGAELKDLTTLMQDKKKETQLSTIFEIRPEIIKRGEVAPRKTIWILTEYTYESEKEYPALKIISKEVDNK